jgi:uncharacterized protein (TIGR03382 family)
VVRIEGLINGATYEVRAKAADLAGNESGYSATQSAVPLPLVGFWDAYRNGGGEDTGGCSAAGGLSLWAAVLLVLVLVRRRSA